MLNEEILQQYATTNTIDDAKELYYAGHVGKISMARGAYDVIEISANVKDSRGYRMFQPNAWLNPEADKVIDFHCGCDESEDETEMCPHVVAMLLKIIYEQIPYPERKYMDDEDVSETSEITGVTGWKRSSDEDIKRFIDTYAKPTLLNQPKLEKNGTIEVLPVLEPIHGTELALSLRIGKADARKYMVRDISAFIENCVHEQFHSYGKRLEFTHKKEVFTSESLPLIQWLVDYDRLYSSFFLTDQASMMGNAFPDTIVLRGVLLDDFFEKAVIHTSTCTYLKVSNQYSFETYECKYEGLNLNLEFYRKADGYVLSCLPFQYFKGQKYLYVLIQDSKTVYGVENTSPLLAPFLDFLKETNGKKQFLAEEDFPAFVQQIYPAISKILPIKVDDGEIEKYLPEQPKFEIYLDSPEKDVIHCRVEAVYNDEKRFNIFQQTEETYLGRNLQAEQDIDQKVSFWFNDFDPVKCVLILKEQEDLIYEFLKDGILSFHKLGEVFISDAMKELKIHSFSSFDIGVRLQSNLLELKIDSDLSHDDLAEILSKYDRRKKFFRLKSGEFIDANEALNEIVELTDALQLSKKQLSKDAIYIPTYRALSLEQYLHEHESFNITMDTHFETLVARMEEMSHKEYPVPAKMEPILRDYQKKGYSWLCSLKEAGFCGLLADEMGLGKTIQVISLILGWENRGRVLVVSPASLVYNWANEFQMFAPELPIQIIAGTAEEREALIKNSKEDEILITSYDLLKRDIHSYLGLEFCLEIIDEAQFIKNPKTKAARSVKGINSDFRIALTGTPIENRLSELWSIFDYLMPGFLFSYKEFQNEFEVPITVLHDDESMERLKQMVTPFTLRRLKKDVLKELPEKLEEVVYAPLEEEQKDLYSAQVLKLSQALERGTPEDFNKHRIEILSEITKLRETCCSPSLLYENYKGNSAKEEMCIELIHRAVASGHKVLLFSQFTSMLDILTKKLKESGIEYYMLTGQTPKKERMELVQAFQNDDVPVFCISLKAGGTGLNLTAADIVIHYDPWWNTAAENQASDRAHRIGQDNIVTVYRLILKDSIEEKILHLQQEKASLAEGVLSDENLSSATLTKEDLLKLL